MNISRTVATLATVLLLGGCSDGLLHRVDQQQGNLVTRTMIKKLKPGMTREQVLFVMGQPILRNSFDSDRWDYIYTFAPRSTNQEKRYLTLYFEEDLLSRIEGDLELLMDDEEESDEI